MKIVYVRRRNDEDQRGPAERDQWKDKSIVFLDEDGSTFRFEGNLWHVQQIKTPLENVIDIRSWDDNYACVAFWGVKAKLDPCNLGMRSLSSQT